MSWIDIWLIPAHSPSGVAPIKIIIGGNMSDLKKRKKDGAFIVRINTEDRTQLNAKAQEAGYQSLSAYVRDQIVRSKPRKRAEITASFLQLQKDLMNLASMINAGKSKSDLLAQVVRTSQNSMEISQ